MKLENTDLCWYYEQADCEVGNTSSHEAIVSMILSGAPEGSSAPTGPSEFQCWAARQQILIRRALREIDRRHAAVLECAYEDRRWNPQEQGIFGKRVVGVVSRIRSYQRDLLCRDEYQAARAIQVGLMALHGRRSKPPEWTAVDVVYGDGVNAPANKRLREAAEQLLHEAHVAFERAYSNHVSSWRKVSNDKRKRAVVLKQTAAEAS